MDGIITGESSRLGMGQMWDLWLRRETGAVIEKIRTTSRNEKSAKVVDSGRG